MSFPHLLVSIVFLVTAQAVAAQEPIAVYDSFRADGSFREGAGAPVDNSLPRIGFAFTPTQSGFLHSIQLPLYWAGGENSALITLCRTDSSSGFPAEPLELFSASGMPEALPPRVTAISLSSSLRPLLSASEQYWLVVAAPAGTTLEWMASYSTESVTAFRTDFPGPRIGPFSDASAFRINVTAVPEPASGYMGIFGALVVILVSPFRRK